MRKVLFVSVVFSSVLFMACGGGRGGMGVMTVDMAMSNTNPGDMAMSQSTGDMAHSTGGTSCQAINTCINNSNMSQSAEQACLMAGSAAGQSQFNAIQTCFQTTCGSLPASGGTGPCGNQGDCVACSQTGTSPTSQTNGTCMNAEGTAGGSDPSCGKCIDQLIACGM
jgi:hypothetical protein